LFFIAYIDEYLCSFLLRAQKKRTKEKGTPISLLSHKGDCFSGLRELAALKQRAALIRKTAAVMGALSGELKTNNFLIATITSETHQS
jgi:hypothetical protein